MVKEAAATLSWLDEKPQTEGSGRLDLLFVVQPIEHVRYIVHTFTLFHKGGLWRTCLLQYRGWPLETIGSKALIHYIQPC